MAGPLEDSVAGPAEEIRQRVDPVSQRSRPERDRHQGAKRGSGENVAREMDSQRDAADREDGDGPQGARAGSGKNAAGKRPPPREPAVGEEGGGGEARKPPAALAEDDRDGDREGRGRVIAGEAGIGRMRGEEVNAMRVGDEGARS